MDYSSEVAKGYYGNAVPNKAQFIPTGQDSPSLDIAGLKSSAEQLEEVTGLLHGTITELEMLLESNGLLRPSPTPPGLAGATQVTRPSQLSGRLRDTAHAIMGARARVQDIFNRVDA